MSTGRAVRRAAGLVAALLAVALLAELALRLSYVGASPALFGGWRRPTPWSAIRTLDASGAPWPRPYGEARWALHPWAAPVHYRLDERGFRVAPGAQRGTAARGACRVLVAGDSNAFGYGVAAADAYPARLADELARRGVAAQVDNGGVCSSTVRTQRAWLERLVPGSEVDVLVLTVSPWSLRVDQPPARDATVGDRLWNVLAQRVRTASAVSSLADRGYRVLGHVLHRLIDWPPDQAVAWELEPLLEPRAEFARRLEEAGSEIDGIARVARASGAGLVLVFVPLDLQVSRARNRLYREERLPYQSFGFVERDYTADDRYREVGRLADGLGAPLVDVTTELREIAERAYLEDDYHLSAAGNARVAAAVAPVVARACDAAVRGGNGQLVARQEAAE